MNKRKAGILLALLLGTALLFYLGGLLGQLLYNYEEWMRQGGMTGGIPMAEISTNLFYCIQNALTANGLRAILFIFLGTGCVALYIKLHNRFGGKEYDLSLIHISEPTRH